MSSKKGPTTLRPLALHLSQQLRQQLMQEEEESTQDAEVQEYMPSTSTTQRAEVNSQSIQVCP